MLVESFLSWNEFDRAKFCKACQSSLEATNIENSVSRYCIQGVHPKNAFLNHSTRPWREVESFWNIVQYTIAYKDTSTWCRIQAQFIGQEIIASIKGGTWLVLSSLFRCASISWKGYVRCSVFFVRYLIYGFTYRKPYNLTTLQLYKVKNLKPYNLTTLQLYSLTALHPYSLTALQPYSLSALQPYSLTTLQPQNLTSL